jgi:hypothetical protein
VGAKRGAWGQDAVEDAKKREAILQINESSTVKRMITIRRGTPLFGPVINGQNDNISYVSPVTVPRLRADLAALIDLINPATDLVLELDYEPRLDLVARIKSPVFDFLLPDEDNYYQQVRGVDVSGRIKPSVADGYWFYIPPLPPRAEPYTLKFGGSIPDLGFELEITYMITVVE